MANYKTTVKNDNPVSFHTFDLDTQALHGGTIIDEIGNKNPMTLYGSNYELEYLSLNPLEPNEQYSILFAKDQKLLGEWSPVWGSIPNSNDYILNEWSIEFFLDIDYAGIIKNSGEVGQYKDIITPIINKGTDINIYVKDSHYSSSLYDGLYCKIFNNSRSIFLVHSTRYPVFGQTIHITATYSVSQIDTNEYESVLKLYANGRLVGTNTDTHFDSPPNMNNTTEWLFCGDGALTDPLTDYPTQFTAIDQLAIYNYSLTPEQVSNHYRKTKTYSEIIEMDYPSYYWRMNDITELNNTMVATVGTNGAYYGDYLKNEPAMDNVIDANSVKFWNDGTAIVHNHGTYSYNQMINTNGNYTVEFWFKSGQNDRGVLFSCFEDLHIYRGVIIYCNSSAGNEQKGIIEFHEGSYTIESEIGKNYTDGHWHYVVIRRYGSSLILNIDGEEVARDDVMPVTGTTGDPAQVHLMGLAGGDFPVNGNMCEVAMYTVALQDIQINSRYHFSSRHKIFGYTLLEGQGISSTVRFYDNITGEKIGEVISKFDGEYTFYTYSNKKLDIVALLPDNLTTRYRIHAPITPAEYDDPHETNP